MTASLPLYFDRSPPGPLVQALSPGGPLSPVLELVRSDPLWDVGFRRFAGAPAAFVYRGRTVLLRIVMKHGGRLHLNIDTPKYVECGFDSSWRAGGLHDDLEGWCPRVLLYLEAAAAVVHPSFISGEAPIQAAVLRDSSSGIRSFDREAVPGWTGTAADRDTVLTPLRAHYDALAGRKCGKEADGLALSSDGDCLYVIECKPIGGNLSEAVAQACWYAGLFRAWWRDGPETAQAQVQGLVDARSKVGLCAPCPSVDLRDVRAMVALEAVRSHEGEAAITQVAAIADQLVGAPLHDDRRPALAFVVDGRVRPEAL